MHEIVISGPVHGPVGMGPDKGTWPTTISPSPPPGEQLLVYANHFLLFWRHRRAERTKGLQTSRGPSPRDSTLWSLSVTASSIPFIPGLSFLVWGVGGWVFLWLLAWLNGVKIMRFAILMLRWFCDLMCCACWIELEWRVVIFL